jgi:hypothetical protein
MPGIDDMTGLASGNLPTGSLPSTPEIPAMSQAESVAALPQRFASLSADPTVGPLADAAPLSSFSGPAEAADFANKVEGLSQMPSTDAWLERLDVSSLEPSQVSQFTDNLDTLSRNCDPSALREGVDAQMVATTESADLSSLMADVPSGFANGRSMLNVADGGTSFAPLNPCNVPSPAGPVPTPLTNVASHANFEAVSSKLAVDGGQVATAQSMVATSAGDAPGTAGGLISGVFGQKTGFPAGGSLSVCVGPEAEAATRFAEVVALNGNSFNTMSIAPGVPTDEEVIVSRCPQCKKPEEDHEVGESEASKGYMSVLQESLTQRFEGQRPLVEDFLALDGQRSELRAKHNDAVEAEGETAGAPALVAQRKEALAELTAKQDRINQRLEALEPVLREDCSTGTYSQGYVIGVALCRCGQQKLAACTGPANPAVVDAVEQAALTLLSLDDQSEEPECDCAAYQLLAKITGEGHRVKALSLRVFQPIQVGGEQEEAPSPECPDCADKLKSMLCNNDKPCAG